jgi:hypothetical protein
LATADAWLNFRWSRQVVPDAMISAAEGLNAVSCLSVASCLAVGGAQDGSALAFQWSGTAWSTLTTPVLQNRTMAGLTDVSCAPAAACMAVGGVVDGRTADTTPVAERWDGFSWTTEAVSSPLGAASSSLTGISCQSAADCTAVGGVSSQPAGGSGYPLVERWDGTQWSSQTAPAPAGTALSELQHVSCTQDTACQAVGVRYAANIGVPFAEGRRGGVWVVESVPLPAGTTSGGLSSVSCITHDWCVAVGTAAGDHGNNVAFIASWDGSTWTVANVTPAPAAETIDLNGISCVSEIVCTAVGSADARGDPTDLVERWNGSTWSVDPGPQVPAGTALNGVSCTSDGSCTVVGSYSTYSVDSGTSRAPFSAQLS